MRRFRGRAQHSSLLALALIAAVGPMARAQLSNRSPMCLPARNADGHPIFGMPTMRVDFEQINGQAGVAGATHAALGDLNGDGLLDAAITLGTSALSYVSVCMNLGNGVFGPPARYTAGREACSVGIGDFDHDGHPDLAVTNAADNTVSILFNRGDGTFGAPVDYAVGNQPRSLNVADFNGDGFPDIAVLNCLSNDVSILINRGDGTFLHESRVLVGNVTQRGDPNLTFAYPGPFMALADFDRNGAPDLAVPAGNQVRLLFNDGSGHFTLSPTALAVHGGAAYCIAADDFNRDGNPDLAAAATGSFACVWLGHGDGTFGPAASYNVEPFEPGAFVFTNHIATGDLDGDGYPDLALGHEMSRGLVSILRNRGDGTFGPAEYVNCARPSWFVALPDLRRTGRADLVVLSSPQRSALRVCLNDGAGRLASFAPWPWPITVPGQSFDVSYGACADLDGDGVVDAVFVDRAGGQQLGIFRGLGGPHFQPVSLLSLAPSGQSSPYGVTLADLNGDGRPDIIVSDPIVPSGSTAPGKIWVLLNLGGFNFTPPVAYPLDAATPTNVVAADLNGDGRPDLVAWSIGVFAGQASPRERRVQVLINRGDGTFSPPVAYTIGTAVGSAGGTYGAVAVADLDHDGRPDVAATFTLFGPTPGNVTILHNRGDGTLEPWQSIPVSAQPARLVAADFNGDGAVDLAVMHYHYGGPVPPFDQPFLTVLYNDGTGRLTSRFESVDQGLWTMGEMIAADFDGDGRPDLAMDDGATFSTVVLLNRGDGTFGRPVSYGNSTYQSGLPWTIMARDWNGDGRTDLLTTLLSEDFLSFQPNLACPMCYANCDGSTTPPILNVNDFICFLNRFAAGDPYANCDHSTTPPVLNAVDFGCFLNSFAAGCP